MAVMTEAAATKIARKIESRDELAFISVESFDRAISRGFESFAAVAALVFFMSKTIEMHE